ncbi:MAG: phosphatidate cytidylyltransferase [Clostridia bacterium]|nr:phosphatidate cytidylyltransferase [Clostridia bacterium]
MAKRIIVALLYLPIFIIVLFFLPPWCSVIFASLLSAIAAYEVLHNTVLVKAPFPLTLGILSALALPAAVCQGVSFPLILFFCLAVLAALFVYGMYHTDRFTFSSIGAVLFGGVVIPCFFSVFPVILSANYGKYLIVLPFLTAWSCDTFAYFTGMAIGKHKLIPHISAKKTVEGSIGGILGCAIALVGYGLVLQFVFHLSPNYPGLVILGLVGSVISQIGDLSMSLIKRENHIKDYGNIMPGHGGILDRFDSVLFVLPVVYAVLSLFPLIG